MQEYIINGLLIVVALLAVILQIIGMRPSAGMTKKQKVMLWRILTATVLLLILQVLGAGAFEVFGAAGRWVRLAVFLVDYLVIGYDIMEKAGKGIRNGQVFDEHFLMAVATLGALALAIYENGDYHQPMNPVQRGADEHNRRLCSLQVLPIKTLNRNNSCVYASYQIFV